MLLDGRLDGQLDGRLVALQQQQQVVELKPRQGEERSEGGGAAQQKRRAIIRPGKEGRRGGTEERDVGEGRRGGTWGRDGETSRSMSSLHTWLLSEVPVMDEVKQLRLISS